MRTMLKTSLESPLTGQLRGAVTFSLLMKMYAMNLSTFYFIITLLDVGSYQDADKKGSGRGKLMIMIMKMMKMMINKMMRLKNDLIKIYCG